MKIRLDGSTNYVERNPKYDKFVLSSSVSIRFLAIGTLTISKELLLTLVIMSNSFIFFLLLTRKLKILYLIHIMNSQSYQDASKSLFEQIPLSALLIYALGISVKT